MYNSLGPTVYIFGSLKLNYYYRGADKSLARPGKKQANVCQTGVNFLQHLALQEKKPDDSLRLDFVEIARVPDTLPRLFPSWSG